VADDFAEGESRFALEPTYPLTVTLAGIGWILYGGLMLGLVAWLLVRVDLAGTSACYGLFCYGLIGLVFLFVGVRSIRGTPSDTIVSGLGSICFGVLNVFFGVDGVMAGLALGSGVWAGGIVGLAGISLIVAGILALVGRSKCKAWRKWRERESGVSSVSQPED
jgi:hypothetical protein